MLKRILIGAFVLMLIIPSFCLAKRTKLEFKSPEGWIFYYEKPVPEERIELLGRLSMGRRSEGKIFLQVYDEAGDYYFFGILMPKEMFLLFSPETRLILKTKSGKEVSSEALFLTDSKYSTRLWDSRREKIKVSQEMMTVGNPPCVVVMAKFPKGSFLVSEVTELKVEKVVTLNLRGALAKEVSLR